MLLGKILAHLRQFFLNAASGLGLGAGGGRPSWWEGEEWTHQISKKWVLKTCSYLRASGGDSAHCAGSYALFSTSHYWPDFFFLFLTPWEDIINAMCLPPGLDQRKWSVNVSHLLLLPLLQLLLYTICISISDITLKIFICSSVAYCYIRYICVWFCPLTHLLDYNIAKQAWPWWPFQSW